MMRAPFGPGGRSAGLDLRPAAMTRASSLIEGFDLIGGGYFSGSV
jgi:hypothetical protein